MPTRNNSLQTPLIKASATGNDFILVDLIHDGTHWLNESAAHSRSHWARHWCDRHNGIGADGALFIESHERLDFSWDFYNSDGSSAEMCGNAARAVALYMSERTGKGNLAFSTLSGEVQAKVTSRDAIDITLAPIAEAQWSQWTSNGVDQLNFDFIRAGVPHAVLQVPDVSDHERLTALAMEVKREPRFQAAGTNVTFVRKRDNDKIESITFERGVEGFTLACGTGAVAAAHSVLRGEENRRLEVHVPGGHLSVMWVRGRPTLTGPARVIARIHWYI